ncbi:MAG: hypothetical protein KDK70_09985 [Myxococcales bacterium]|nr:hypothetical protein [Myxococcales bacterium]
MIELVGLVGLVDPPEGEGPCFGGTLRYLAREQARGRPGPASDLFGVGAILHELLDGRRFRHTCPTDEALRAEILLGGIPPLPRRVPGPVESLRRGLLEPRAELRIPSAEHALERLLAWPGYRPRRARLEALYREVIGPPRCGPAWVSWDESRRARLDRLRRRMAPVADPRRADESSSSALTQPLARARGTGRAGEGVPRARLVEHADMHPAVLAPRRARRTQVVLLATGEPVAREAAAHRAEPGPHLACPCEATWAHGGSR